MDATTLAIIVAILSPVVPLGIEAVKAHGKFRIVFGVAAGVFVLAALLWVPIAKASPAIAKVAREIASTPSTWFTIGVVLVIFAHHWWARRAFLAEQENALYPMGIGAEALHDIEGLWKESRKLHAAHQALLPEVAKAAGAIPVLDAQVMKLIERHKSLEEQAERRALELETLKETVQRLSTSNMAMGHRELLLARAAEINDLAIRLSVENEHDAMARDWDEWARREAGFRHDLSAWVEIAKFYDDQITGKIYSVTEETYLDGHWTLGAEAFPNQNVMVRYRTFRTIYGKWRQQEEAVRRANSALAYGY